MAQLKKLFSVATEEDFKDFDDKLNTVLSNEKTVEKEVNSHISLLKALNNKTMQINSTLIEDNFRNYTDLNVKSIRVNSILCSANRTNYKFT